MGFLCWPPRDGGRRSLRVGTAIWGGRLGGQVRTEQYAVTWSALRRGSAGRALGAPGGDP